MELLFVCLVCAVVISARSFVEGKADKIALVTGASRGLGREIALELAKRGHGYDTGVQFADKLTVPVKLVICVSRSLAGCEETVNHINQLYPAVRGGSTRAVAHSVDVGNGADVRVLVEKLIAKHKRIDILVNNAGITRDSMLMRMSVDDWESVISTNLNSVFYFTRAVIKEMMQNKWGRIVNIASVSGITGQLGQTNYSSAKSGVMGLTKTVAKELGKFGITVNSVAPGVFESDMTKNFKPLLKKAYLSQIPAGRFGKAQEVANSVVFSSSNEASYISGQTFIVDGALAPYSG
eukprot:Lankesteria_metandrocarpae@DN415_c0_g1_i1.p1